MPRSQDSKPNTLSYALLGLLARGERTGYDLAQGLKYPIGFFWNAQHSQIYPQLAKLEASGLIEHTRVEQSDRPDKKVYNLTSAGRESLRAWLEAPMDVPKHRDELVLKAYSVWLTDPAAAANMMREHARAHAEQLAEFERRLELLKHKVGGEMDRLDSPRFGTHAVLMRGIGFEREYLRWCQWMVERLSAPPETVGQPESQAHS